ncbi:MAG TPA: methionyl-tRNA formyltransferase [Dongiaceae bacterium]|nr:methionyl-tRNA formyltransferase [Dongiaceae bacterium]
MTRTSKTVVFFGTDHFSAVSLNELIDKGFRIAAVVTKPDSKKGRGRQLSKSLVKEIAEAHHIPVWQPERASDIVAPLQELIQEEGAKPVGVLVSYGKIIPQAVIDLFEPGIVNVHPSLLPQYRGPSPIESAILHGDTETGVSIMQLSKAMDAGPLYTQTVFNLNDTETAPELEQKLAELGAQELTIALPKIVSGALQPVPQADDLASYCALLKKEDSLLDPTTITAEQAERRVRAYIAFPKTKATVAGHQIVITKAHVSSSASTILDLQCADGRYLSIDELVGPSGRGMTAKAFLNGYGSQA